MINKNQFKIKNNKKTLHKIGKNWVVISAILLGLISGGMVINQAAKADVTQPQPTVVKSVKPTSQAKKPISNPSSSNSSRPTSTTAKPISSAANKSKASSQAKSNATNSSKASSNSNNNMQVLNLGTKTQQARAWNFIQFGIHHHDFDSYGNYGGYGKPTSASYTSNTSSKASASSVASNPAPTPTPTPMPSFPIATPISTPMTSDSYTDTTSITTNSQPPINNVVYENHNTNSNNANSSTAVTSKPKSQNQTTYINVIKSLVLHTNKHFTKHNGIKLIKPGTSLKIMKLVKDHKHPRYAIKLKNKIFYITANPKFTTNTYIQKKDFKRGHKMLIELITPVNEYKSNKFNKHDLVKHLYKNAKLHVKKVVTLNKGYMTCLQLSKNRFITANKNFVKII